MYVSAQENVSKSAFYKAFRTKITLTSSQKFANVSALNLDSSTACLEINTKLSLRTCGNLFVDTNVSAAVRRKQRRFPQLPSTPPPPQTTKECAYIRTILHEVFGNLRCGFHSNAFLLSPPFRRKAEGHGFRLSVRPSVPLKYYVPCVRNSSYSFMPIHLKLYRCFCHGLKICMWFAYYPEIIFCHFFRSLNLVTFRRFYYQSE